MLNLNIMRFVQDDCQKLVVDKESGLAMIITLRVKHPNDTKIVYNCKIYFQVQKNNSWYHHAMDLIFSYDFL